MLELPLSFLRLEEVMGLKVQSKEYWSEAAVHPIGGTKNCVQSVGCYVLHGINLPDHSWPALIQASEEYATSLLI